MALQKDETLQAGTNLSSVYSDFDYCTKNIVETITSTYQQITGIQGNKENITLVLSVYKDSTKNNLLTTKNYTFTPSVIDDSTNFIQQGYDYLKTLDEFKNATDC